MSAATGAISIDLNGSSTFLTTGSVTGIEALGENSGNRFQTGSGNDTTRPSGLAATA